MAFTTTYRAAASSSSSSHSGWIYDVFLSFRGEDTRYGFTNNLYHALIHNGIRTFRDDENLPRGGEIAPELLRAIEGSRISIVVFSETYAHSKWCLEELAKIMECKKGRGQTVIPVFFHVDPSEQVRKQRGIYGEAFADHERDADEDEEKRRKIQKWRTALSEAGTIAGHHIPKNAYELANIEDIITEIRRLVPKPLHVDGKIVGIDEKLKEVRSLIDIQSNDIRMVKIYGIGGIGKTTITKILYNDILDQFEGSSFLQNVRENSKDASGLLRLQEKLLHDVMKVSFLKIHDIGDGVNMIKMRLSQRKVLIVLDDVVHSKQIEFLVGSCEWFGLGSRIIITTRDIHCLYSCQIYASYEVKGLNFKEAIELFSWNAFHQSYPKDGYVELTKYIVDYSKGHPLALCLLGSSLLGRKVSEWKSELQMLKRNLPMDIKKVLEISYVGLEDTWKELFLDIACFFKNKEKNHVIRILESCHPGVELGISILDERCLITLANGIIEMHDLLQEMGYEIVRQECPREPGKWRRLWEYEDINRVFTTNTGTETIEGIFLDISGSKEIPFTTKAFKVMKNLRLLKVYVNDRYPNFEKLKLPKDLEFPSQELRYLHWVNYSLKSLSSYFNGKKLVELSLRFSKIQRIWKRSEILNKLKVIDLSHSEKLIEMPKFSNMPNLESLNLTGCTSLHKLHSSIGVLKKLTSLNLSESGIKELPRSIGDLESLEFLDLSCCRNFEQFPEVQGIMRSLKLLYLRETAIKELPSSFGCLESLQILRLSGCRKFEKFPEIFENMRRLWQLDLSETGIKELPSSFGCLESLQELNLRGCRNFEKFPEIFGNIRDLRKLHLGRSGIKELPSSFGCLEFLGELDLDHCRNFEKFPEIQRNMEYLMALYFDGTGIAELPSSIGYLTGLTSLYLENCNNLRSLPSSIWKLESLEYLDLISCSNLEALPEITEVMENLVHLVLCGIAIKELSSSIENLSGLRTLHLSYCENLVALPDSIGNLTGLRRFKISHCPKLQKLPNNLSSLSLEELDLSGCHLVEGAIPSDLWSLYSLKKLDISQNDIRVIPAGIIQLSSLTRLSMNNCKMLEEIPSDLWSLYSLKELDINQNDIRVIPAGIIQLSSLTRLSMNNCQMLEEIPELPSSLQEILARGCPGIETLLSDERSTLWSSGVKYLVSYTDVEQNPYIQRKIKLVQLGGINGIPEWVHHKNKGDEVKIDLPPNWYRDNAFLGFAVFFHSPPVNVYDGLFERCKLTVCLGDEYEVVDDFDIYWENSDQVLWVEHVPKISISTNHPSNQWTKFKASFTYLFGAKQLTEVSCGIHLVYAEAHHQQNESGIASKRRRIYLEYLE